MEGRAPLIPARQPASLVRAAGRTVPVAMAPQNNLKPLLRPALWRRAGLRLQWPSGTGTGAIRRLRSLDAGGPLRVVVYGQEGLTNTMRSTPAARHPAADRVRLPARGAHPPGGRGNRAKRRRFHPRCPRFAVETKPTGRSSILGEVAAPAISLRAEKCRWRAPSPLAGAYRRAPAVTVSRATTTTLGPRALCGIPMGTSLSPGDTAYSSANDAGSDPAHDRKVRRPRILHARRAPVGGTSANILDLANGQADTAAITSHHRRRAYRRRCEPASGRKSRRASRLERASFGIHSEPLQNRDWCGRGSLRLIRPPETGSVARPWRQGRRVHR